MMTCTFGEFTMANSLLDSFSKTKKQKCLDEMLAVFTGRGNGFGSSIFNFPNPF
jgi:hypothetical protein